MKYSEFRKWFKSLGAEFKPAKGSHFRVALNGKTTIFRTTAARIWESAWLSRLRNSLD
jgi:mRNA interferase HicA